MPQLILAYHWPQRDWPLALLRMHQCCVVAHEAYVRALAHAACVRASGEHEAVARQLTRSVEALKDSWRDIERAVMPAFLAYYTLQYGTPAPRTRPLPQSRSA